MKRISLYRSLPLFIAVRGMWAAFGRHFTVLQRKKRAERRSENANKPSIHAAFRRSTDCIGHFEAGTKSYYFLLYSIGNRLSSDLAYFIFFLTRVYLFKVKFDFTL